jgi:hypothetical protein
MCEYPDWERIARELAGMISGVEGLRRYRGHVSPSLEPSSGSMEYTADALLEHIARALDECVIPRGD